MSNVRSNFIDENHEISTKLKSFYESNPYGDRRYKGVTRVLGLTKSEEDKAFLEKWKQDVGEEKAEQIVQESMNIGNSLDMIIEKYMDPGFNYSDYKSEVGIQLFNQVLPVLSKIKPVGTQIHLYSDRYMIQGYLDCIGYYKDTLYMIDFKNSRKIKTENQLNDYYLQCTIYCMLLHEMTGIIIKDIMIILAIRNSNTPQIKRIKLVDYVKIAKERLNKYKQIRDK